jgi:ubiquinol-cytochrome c reductase iron-sulfur subunit
LFGNKAFVVAALLVLAMLSAVGFAANFALGAQTQIGGATLGLTFAFFAAALVVWESQLMKHADAVEDMAVLQSDDATRTAAESTFSEGLDAIAGRRTWLVRLLAGTVGVVGLAALFPLRSFAPKGSPSLAHTSWRCGLRLVREDGTLVRASDLEINAVMTVFPEGHTGPSAVDDMANTATMLVRVPPEELALPADRAAWAPQGLLAYSKVCTHAGCPVALYRAKARQLLCPCHQSTFDVLTGGNVVFGPAARGLPQLPIAIADDGTLHATGDFPEPIGPGYWERG